MQLHELLATAEVEVLLLLRGQGFQSAPEHGLLCRLQSNTRHANEELNNAHIT